MAFTSEYPLWQVIVYVDVEEMARRWLVVNIFPFFTSLTIFSLHSFTKQLTVSRRIKTTMFPYWGFIILMALASLTATHPTGNTQVWGQLRENVSGPHSIYNPEGADGL